MTKYENCIGQGSRMNEFSESGVLSPSGSALFGKRIPETQETKFTEARFLGALALSRELYSFSESLQHRFEERGRRFWGMISEGS